ncbi:MAG TPA: metal-dependent hydrolase [Candidatus Methanoperedens sp.]
MNLPTHAVFGIAVGLVFFGRPEIALLIGLGALLPDLDREYWFIPPKIYHDEQYHRALFHNVFIMALAYLVSPFFSLGIFLHILQDSFTTSKDRGCEWFYPLSRLVKRGRYDANAIEQPLDPKERVYYYQEDPKGLIDKADQDLRESGPCPWRRVYGPALNSGLLDYGFLYGSLVLILVWLLAPDGSHLAILSNNPIIFYRPYLVGYFSLSIFYLAGELDRRDRNEPRIQKLSFLKKPLFILGFILLVTWFVLYRSEIWANLATIFSNWISILLGAVLITFSSLILIEWKIRKGKDPAFV